MVSYTRATTRTHLGEPDEADVEDADAVQRQRMIETGRLEKWRWLIQETVHNDVSHVMYNHSTQQMSVGTVTKCAPCGATTPGSRHANPISPRLSRSKLSLSAAHHLSSAVARQLVAFDGHRMARHLLASFWSILFSITCLLSG